MKKKEKKERKRYAIFFFWGGGGTGGQVRCIMGDAQMANSPTRPPTLFSRLFPFSRHFLTEKLLGRVCLKIVAYGTFQKSQTCQEDVESFVQMPR